MKEGQGRLSPLRVRSNAHGKKEKKSKGESGEGGGAGGGGGIITENKSYKKEERTKSFRWFVL